MPVLKDSYKPPFWLRSGHLQTIYSSAGRRVKSMPWEGEQVILSDEDEVNLYWLKSDMKRLLIQCPGLESDLGSRYLSGMGHCMTEAGWDVVSYIYRGCDGKDNKALRTYHSGAIDDLSDVIQYILSQYPDYEEIGLIGYSLGANLVLRYLGDPNTQLDPKVKKSVAISPPCDLAASSEEMKKLKNKFYTGRFIQKLKGKVKLKEKQYPEALDYPMIYKSKNFHDFDQHFTAPANNFKDAKDYWHQSSSLFYLKNISIPSLIITARDDSLLSESSYPYQIAESCEHIHLMATRFGGHVGFMYPGEFYWHELQAKRFLNS